MNYGFWMMRGPNPTVRHLCEYNDKKGQWETTCSRIVGKVHSHEFIRRDTPSEELPRPCLDCRRSVSNRVTYQSKLLEEIDSWRPQ